MKIIRLKSTKQEVFNMPWTAQAVRPWPQGYSRVQRPFNFPEGSRSNMFSKVMIIRDINLEEATV